METNEVSERYIAPCFWNGLEAYDGEINLAFDENLISNEYVVKLLDYEVNKANKRGNHCLSRTGPVEDDYEKTEKSMDDWDQLLDFNFDDIPQLDGEELSSFVCKMGKSSRNKKRSMENLNLFYQDIGTSSSTGRNLTQEKAAKEALALRISKKFALLEEVRPVLETMTYHNKYKKVLDEIWKNKVELDGMILVGEFLYTIGGIFNTPERLFSNFDGICHQTFRAARSDVLRTAKSDNDDEEEYEIKRNKFRAPIYGPKPTTCLNCNDPAELWEEKMMKLDHQDPNDLDNLKPWRKYCFCKFIMNSYYRKVATKMQSLEIDNMIRIKLREVESNEEIFTFVAWLRAFNINEPIYSELCHEFYSTYEFDKLGLYHAEELDEPNFEGDSQNDHLWLVSDDYWYDKIQKNDLWLLSMFDARHQNGYTNVAWLIARWIKRKGVGTQKESQICCGQFIMKLARKARVLSDEVLRSLSALIYYRDLDTTTLRDFLDSKGRLIPEDPQPGVSRVGIPRPREHQCRTCMIGSGAYNPPGYAQPQYDRIISSTHLSHRNNSSKMMMSSVEMTQVGCVIACFGSQFLGKFSIKLEVVLEKLEVFSESS
nr:hypothetical protein [Tanacetum cinerariifolium]